MRFPRPAAIEWLYLAAGLALASRYCWILDDAFVFFRYADNLLFLGIGLVYNHGECVEGYSSPLWLMLLALLRAAGMNYGAVVRLAAPACVAAFWLLVVKVNRALSPPAATVDLPCAALMCTYGTACYFSSGTESPLVQLAAPAFALYILDPSSIPLQLLLALSPLVRGELALPLALCMLWAWRYHRRFPARLLAAAALFNGAWLCFRIWYYADLFPNTFYLKSVANPAQGLAYLRDTAWAYHAWPVLATACLLLALLRARGPSGRLLVAPRLMMLAAASSVAAYAVWIGGAAVHYRYLAFPFCLAVCSLGGIAEGCLGALGLGRSRPAAFAAGLAAALASLTSYPRQLDRHPLLAEPRHRAVDKINDALPHRLADTWGVCASAGPDALRRYRAEHPRFSYRGIEASYSCADIYRRFDTMFVHSYGLTDAVLARVRTKSERAGHKEVLKVMAEDIVRMRRADPQGGRGVYRRAAGRGTAPRWATRNLEGIDAVERKVYNRHLVGENLSLALTLPPRIQGPRLIGPGTPRRGRE